MRILHARDNIAGQASTIAKAQRELGAKSDSLVFNNNSLLFDSDINLDLYGKSKAIRTLSIITNFIKCVFRYDVFHLHFGSSLLWGNLDLPILRLLNKKIIMHYWGSDIRQLDIAVNYTHLSMGELREIYPNADDNKKREKLNYINKYIDLSIVGDYSLLPYSPHSVVVRQAIDVSKFQSIPPKSANNDNKLMIIHAPTNRKIKGTKHILPTIDRLKEEGYKINFVLIENKTNKEALKIYAEADIIIDSIMMEGYGILAIECMMLGKPVLCRIDDKLMEYYPNIPILSTNPDNLYANLKMLIDDPKLRKELGIRGRTYCENIHDSKKIAEQLNELYSAL